MLRHARDEVFEDIRRGVERSFTVGHIATFQVDGCQADEDANDALKRAAAFGYDQMPVRRDQVVVGVLDTNCRSEGSCAESMRPLEERLLVGNEEDLVSFLRTFRANFERQKYWLVLRKNKIDGLVTQSDLLKLPVRTMAFALVMHFEQLMVELIGRTFPGDAWVDLLSASAQRRLRRVETRLKHEHLDTSLLNSSYLSDKTAVLMRQFEFQDEEDEFAQINALRNSVAHAKDYVFTEKALGEFLHRFELTEKWIDRLLGLLSERDAWWQGPADEDQSGSLPFHHAPM